MHGFQNNFAQLTSLRRRIGKLVWVCPSSYASPPQKKIFFYKFWFFVNKITHSIPPPRKKFTYSITPLPPQKIFFLLRFFVKKFTYSSPRPPPLPTNPAPPPPPKKNLDWILLKNSLTQPAPLPHPPPHKEKDKIR